MLCWKERHLPDPVLSRRAPDIYEHLSSVYVSVQTAGYGTRTHTIVLVDAEGNVELTEETMKCPLEPSVEPEWTNSQFQAHL